MADILALPLCIIHYQHATAIQDRNGIVLGEIQCTNHPFVAAALVQAANAGFSRDKPILPPGAITIDALAEAEAAICRGVAPIVANVGVGYARMAAMNVIDRVAAAVPTAEGVPGEGET